MLGKKGSNLKMGTTRCHISHPKERVRRGKKTWARVNGGEFSPPNRHSVVTEKKGGRDEALLDSTIPEKYAGRPGIPNPRLDDRSKKKKKTEEKE